ncbi:MAG TPA: methyltransferase domain-containing protein [Patescibacteria group bacterium]|nr:methyltransferase domain-containing protein [Patescibacteria group bacterium]
MKQKDISDLSLSLPFDQYSRQKIASELIQSLRTNNEKLSILDVGGYKGATYLFQKNDAVTVLDVFDVHEENYVKGDGTNMDFGDNSFDYVVSFDVFEHIPRDKRESFVSECTRVAKRGVIIAAPVATPQNAGAEVFLNDMFAQLHGKDHPWLKEHIDYHLPELGLSQKLLKKYGLHTLDVPSNYLPLWLLMQATIFAASKTDKVGKRIDGLYEMYNKSVHPDGAHNPEENYRVVSIGVKSQKDLDTLKKTMGTADANHERNFNNCVVVAEKVTQVLVQALNEFFEVAEDRGKQIDMLKARFNDSEKKAAEKQNEVAALKSEIDVIKKSRSYRLATKMAKAKNYPNRVLKGGDK